MNLAILGLGSIGQRHGRNAIDLGHRVFGYDPDAEKRAEFEQAGGEICDSGSVAIENAEAVVIASPNRAHLDDLRLAINNRRHVMAEKPLAHDDIGVEDLLDQASQGGQVIFCGPEPALQSRNCGSTPIHHQRRHRQTALGPLNSRELSA